MAGKTDAGKAWTGRFDGKDLKTVIRTVPNFPKKGIMYRDITTLIKDPLAYRHAISGMKKHFSGMKIDKIVSPESRGFIFGGVLAHEMGISFVPLRKPGKLPWKTVKHEYMTEYSKDAIEMHADAITPGDRVLLIDDLLATGGTIEAAAKLVEKQGAKVVGLGFIIELSYLGGRERLRRYHVFSLVDYKAEEEG
jgi:adenine phosphoribosyltransferase